MIFNEIPNIPKEIHWFSMEFQIFLRKSIDYTKGGGGGGEDSGGFRVIV